MVKIPPRIEKEILSAFNSGVVPRQGAGFVQVGRNTEFRSIKADLDSTGEKDGMGKFRFITGNYGAGKSFMLQFIREFSLKTGFVVMDADLSNDRRFTGSNKEGLKLYRELIRNMSTDTYPTGGALEMILNKWVDGIRNELADRNGVDLKNISTMMIQTEIRQRTREMTATPMYSDFIRMVTRYWLSSSDSRMENKALDWLKGDYEQRSLARQDLDIGIIVDDSNWYQFIKIWSGFVVSMGYKGLIVIIDEGVNLAKQHSKTREKNYECILSMYNDINSGKSRNLSIYMSETPQGVDDVRRGLYSYDPLRTRLEPGRFVNGYNNQFGPIMTLRYLNQSEVEALLMILREIHAHVHKYESRVTDDDIKAFVRNAFRMEASGNVTPRVVTKQFLGVLDILNQDESLDFMTVIGGVRIEPDSYSETEDISGALEV